MITHTTHRFALTVAALAAATLAVFGLPSSASARTSDCGFWDSCQVGGSLTISLAPPQTTNGFINALQVASGQAQVQAYIGTALCQNMGLSQNIASVIWQESTDGGQTWVTILETAIGGGPLSLGLLPDGQKTDIRAELTYANLGGYGFRGCPHGTVLATSNVVGPIVYDATPPVTSVVVPAKAVASTSTLTLAATDTEGNFAGSGVAWTEWRTDVSGVIHKGTTVTLPKGALGNSHVVTLLFNSADNAGNTESWKTARVWIKPDGSLVCEGQAGVCTGTTTPPVSPPGCPTGDVCSGGGPSPAPNAPPTGYVGIPNPAAAANEPPVAVAYVSAEHGTTAVVDGRNSYDPDGWIARYTWKLSGKTIGAHSTVTHKFPAAKGTKRYTVMLTVADNGKPALTASTKVIVTVTPTGVQAPKVVKLSIPGDVLFNWNKYTIRPDAAKVLLTLKPLVAQAATVEIDGYTDSTGEAAYNMTLSKERAAAVAKVLKTGSAKMVEHWYGETRPLPGAKCVDLTSTWHACQLNRRSTITITRK